MSFFELVTRIFKYSMSEYFYSNGVTEKMIETKVVKIVFSITL